MTDVATELLIVGGESDPNTQRIVDQAHLRGKDYVFWDTDRPDARQIAWDFQSPVIDLGGDSIRPQSVFLRYNVFQGDPAQNHAAFDAVESFALAWPEIRLLNRAVAGDSNNKSRNLRRAKDCGFRIPESLVLGDLSPLATVPDPHQRIIKPLAGGDHTLVIGEMDRTPERLAALVPQFVQEKLAGENLRVFSIGGELFAFHLSTTAIDYRTDQNVQVFAMEVPGDVIDSELTERIGQLVGTIGFDYCALDFRCQHDFETPVFLEINSFPMFVAFDDAAENRLADAMLRVLTGP
ncbi:hypothetical protein FYK55_01210 [Roseiconus nitratireducens]|uniref:ATP-grasp domain-containing protein n=1 Tax=Roseiconus nitratireducens TaxID=2605748 RepID=A0A5M6DKZ5_9BACT|nr:hypothetical protein [Roseiconus nitratireducens]KAA5547066.1 hypothetical protein FYK55_01210 [Roseiconus nitratireducens]